MQILTAARPMMPSYTYAGAVLTAGGWQKNTMRKTPATPATVRMMKSVVLESAVITVSSANRKYTMRLPNSRLTETNTLPNMLTTCTI